MTSITERLKEQRERIAEAARAAGRDPASVQLLAVSKRHPISAIEEAYAAGQRDFGENYAQEMVQKADALAHLRDLRFHLIGHLQSNKARLATRAASSVQTVSSTKLALELGKRMAQRQPTVQASPHAADKLRGGAGALDAKLLTLDVLVEVNVGGETSKSGCAPEQLSELLAAVDGERLLRLRGLMTIPPPGQRAEESRPYFEQMAALQAQHGGVARLPELSMGMSADAEVAIACGATQVRIGTAIFGPRPVAPPAPDS